MSKSQDDIVKQAQEIFNDIPKIAYSEYSKRKNAWEEYYLKIRTGRAYARYVSQKEAYRQGDMATFKRLAQEAKDVILNQEPLEFVKPPFSDPGEQIRKKQLAIA